MDVEMNGRVMDEAPSGLRRATGSVNRPWDSGLLNRNILEFEGIHDNVIAAPEAVKQTVFEVFLAEN